jgi:hypothetical protein
MQQLAVVVPQLLALLAKSSLLLVMSLLTELLVADKPLGQAILTSCCGCVVQLWPAVQWSEAVLIS